MERAAPGRGARQCRNCACRARPAAHQAWTLDVVKERVREPRRSERSAPASHSSPVRAPGPRAAKSARRACRTTTAIKAAKDQPPRRRTTLAKQHQRLTVELRRAERGLASEGTPACEANAGATPAAMVRSPPHRSPLCACRLAASSNSDRVIRLSAPAAWQSLPWLPRQGATQRQSRPKSKLRWRAPIGLSKKYCHERSCRLRDRT